MDNLIKKTWPLILTTLFSVVNVMAQVPGWKTFTKSNSDLPNNRVTAIAIDKDGVAWIGTQEGLVRIANEIWTVFTLSNSDLPGNFITALVIDDNDALWIGTNTRSGTNQGGLAKYDGQNWTVFDTNNSGLPDNAINGIALDVNNNIWLGSGSSIVEFDGTDWTVYNSNNSGLPNNGSILTITVDHNNTIWIGSYLEGLTKFDGTDWFTYTTSNSGLVGNFVKTLLVDPNNNLWIGTWPAQSFGGIAKFNGNEWTTYTTTNSGLHNPEINSLAIDDSTNLWVGTNDGMAKFDGEQWTIFKTDNSGLLDNSINTIAIDNYQKIWVGTGIPNSLVGTGGLAIYDPSNPDNLSPIISSNPTQFVFVDSLYTYDIQASDPNGDSLSYRLESDAPFLSLNETTLSGIPTIENIGKYSVAIIVSDGRGGSDTQSFDLIVKENTPVSIQSPNTIPTDFRLEQNYPNPFNPSTTISYSIPVSGVVTLTIFDIIGNEIKQPVNKFQKAGEYSVDIQLDKLSSGVYFYELKIANRFVKTKKMILMR